MGHLADGALRRLVDDERAAAARDREHYATCARCRDRYAMIAAEARAAAVLLSRPAPEVDAARALERVRPRLATRSWSVFDVLRLGGGGRAVAAAALVLALLGGLAVSGLAGTLLDVFEPRQFVAIRVSSGDLGALPDLSAYGTMESVGSPLRSQVADLAAATSRAGFQPALPASLPDEVVATPTYWVSTEATVTFTFSAERARATAARQGQNIPAMPTNVDGSRLVATIHPMISIEYPARGSSGGHPPALVVVQTRAPVVTSSGATVAEIREYLLAQPGISPALAAQLRAIGDPNTTVPVPIPIDQASAKEVRVRGVRGLFVGDSTGLGSGVIWVSDGFVYFVGGMLTEDQVLAVANSLR